MSGDAQTQKNESIASAENAEALSKTMRVLASRVTEASEKRSEQKEYDCRNTENSDDDSLNVPRRLVDEAEVVHYVKKDADNASVDLNNSRETNPARLVWPGPNPSLILYRFPNRQGSESSSSRRQTSPTLP